MHVLYAWFVLLYLLDVPSGALVLLGANSYTCCTHSCSLLPSQLFQELFWLAPNVYMLIVPCGWFDRFVGYCMALRWSCLNLVSPSTKKLKNICPLHVAVSACMLRHHFAESCACHIHCCRADLSVLAQIFMVFVITGHNTNPWADKDGALSPLQAATYVAKHIAACTRSAGSWHHLRTRWRLLS